jgi:hypothetical protein
VVAPVFGKRAFPAWRYQRGGIVKDAVVQNARDWTGTLVLDLVAWAREQEGRPLPYSLLGHSAGGQFPEPEICSRPLLSANVLNNAVGRAFLLLLSP